MINGYVSPIRDDNIEKYLDQAKAGQRRLSLKATTDGKAAYADAEYVIIATPTNYDPDENYFDCSAVENVLTLVKEATSARDEKPVIVIKSTVPVGYTVSVRERFGMDNIVFSPEFLRESKALYDNLYPSRIIVGREENNRDKAETFAKLLQQGALKSPIETLFMGCTEAEATKLFVITPIWPSGYPSSMNWIPTRR